MKSELEMLFEYLDENYRDKSIKEMKKDLKFINRVLGTNIKPSGSDQESWSDAIVLGTHRELQEISNKEMLEKIEIISDYVRHRT